MTIILFLINRGIELFMRDSASFASRVGFQFTTNRFFTSVYFQHYFEQYQGEPEQAFAYLPDHVHEELSLC